MKKIISNIGFFCILFSSIFANTTDFEFIFSLNPSKNYLEKSNSNNYVLLYKWASNVPVISFNTNTLNIKNVDYQNKILESNKFSSMSIFNPFTNNNFTWISRRNLFDDYTNPGTYKIKYLPSKNEIDFDFYSDYELLFESNFLLKNNLEFAVNMIQETAGNFNYTYNFLINDKINNLNETISRIKTNDTIGWFWISEDWYTKFSSYSFFQDYCNNSIYNYRTNEEIIFTNQTIIAYGKNIIVTSRIDLETKKLNGIYVYDINGQVLYEEINFNLTEIISTFLENELSKVVIFQGYFCNNCIILNLRQTTCGPSIPFCTLIINLDSNKVYKSPTGYELLGVFS